MEKVIIKSDAIESKENKVIIESDAIESKENKENYNCNLNQNKNLTKNINNKRKCEYSTSFHENKRQISNKQVSREY